MTRGNQRERDRERAANRQKRGPQNAPEHSGVKLVERKERDAEIMRQKQLAALQKAQETGGK